MNRRESLLALSGLSIGLASRTVSAQAPAKTKAAPKPASATADLVWHDVTEFGLEGRLWADRTRARYFDRFPAEAEAKIPKAVWGLSRDSAGMTARFDSDSPTVAVRYTLSKDRLAMPHMPATGVSGVDLYARDDKGAWRWVNVTMPESKTVESVLLSGVPARGREFQLYLPLYNGVDKLEIGVVKNAKFEGHAPREKPIVFYGTSITHGACASRPGMVHTAILARRLDRPVTNLGFSGNGRMDTGVGELLGLVDAAAFVIDCLPNMDAALVTERTVPFVQALRKARPQTPIVLVEDRRNTNSWIFESRANHHTANHAALKKAYDSLVGEGVSGLFYIPGDDLLGDDSEGATDGSHPNDLGFYRQALAMEPTLKKALVSGK
jgi:lysophospholipase L1-like esterase